MKNALLLLLIFTSITVFAQVEPEDRPLAVPDRVEGEQPDSLHIDSLGVDSLKRDRFVLGVGFNIIDNTSTRNNQFLNWAEHYNVVPMLSKVSLERRWKPLYSTDVAFTFNQLRKGVIQNGEFFLNEHVNYFALDVKMNLYIDEFFMKKEWLEIFVCSGLGIHTADNEVNQTFDVGGGLNVWVFPRTGLRLQTLGKFAFDTRPLANNHIQHSAEVLFKF